MTDKLYVQRKLKQSIIKTSTALIRKHQSS